MDKFTEADKRDIAALTGTELYAKAESMVGGFNVHRHGARAARLYRAAADKLTAEGNFLRVAQAKQLADWAERNQH